MKSISLDFIPFLRLFTAYFLVFWFDRWTRRKNRERAGREHKTEDLTWHGKGSEMGAVVLLASLANSTPTSACFARKERGYKQSILSLWPSVLGFCSSQGYTGNDPRNLHPAFKELAELTSGQAILLKDHWELEELDGLTGGVLEGTNVISMGSNMSNRKKRSTDGAADSRYNIPVDESIEKMIVTVSTTKLDTKGGYFLQGQHPAIWAI